MYAPPYIKERNVPPYIMERRLQSNANKREGGGVLVNTELDTDLSPNSMVFHPRFDDDDDDAALEYLS